MSIIDELETALKPHIEKILESEGKGYISHRLADLFSRIDLGYFVKEVVKMTIDEEVTSQISQIVRERVRVCIAELVKAEIELQAEKRWKYQSDPPR